MESGQKYAVRSCGLLPVYKRQKPLVVAHMHYLHEDVHGDANMVEG